MHMRVHPLAPVVALDLDGTLARYHEHFVRFAEQYLQRPLVPIWRAEYRGEFSRALGLEKHVYRQIKLAYRQGGLKRSIPPMDDRVEAEIQYIRSTGVQVWIATTRPWMRLDNIDPDTQFWLARNAGRVDGVIFGEEKYEDLIDIVGKDRILGVVDDLPENVRAADALGLKAVMMCGDHNQWFRAQNRNAFPTINRVKDISRFVDRWHEDYKMKESSNA